MAEDTSLEAKNIVKDYPGVRALDHVNFAVRKGEVHALIGENGAGKSTLMKILSGAETKTSGEIFLEAKKVEIGSPRYAEQLGISIIYQEFNLVPFLSVAENIFLGREPVRKSGFVDWEKLYQSAERILERLGIRMDLKTPIYRLSVARQQMVEIAKALSVNAKIIIMDEPSAALTLGELETLFNIIRELRKEGISIIYISHRLDEIFHIADRVTVFRDGKWVATEAINRVSRDDLIRMMVGREITEEFPKQKVKIAEEVLRVEGIKRGDILNNINFSLHKGEILGITGLIGAGRTELVRAIFGADSLDEGNIYLGGNLEIIDSPSRAIQLGISLLTEDRKNQGLVLPMTVRENISLSNLKAFCRYGFVNKKEEKNAIYKFIEELKIRTPSLEQEVRYLSGGNQQKVVLAKWLLAKSKVVIFDEPTRGIDVGAKVDIYSLLTDLVRRGIGIIIVSSELPEVINMADRVLVMHEGKITGELRHQEATQEKIMHYAIGGK